MCAEKLLKIYELVFFKRICSDLITSFGLSIGAFSGNKSVTHPIIVSISVNNFLQINCIYVQI